MKQFLFATALILSINASSQDTIPLRSISEAIIESEKGNYVSLLLYEDTSSTFPESFFSIPKSQLVGLIVDDCNYQVLPSQISEYPNLLYFRYSWFYFNDSPLKQFPEFIPLSTKLNTVVIEGVKFDSIPSLVNLKNVETWSFLGCHLQTFPRALLDLTNLTDLTLACDDYTELPADIDRLANLKYINFQGGACGSTPIKIIPKSLSNLKKLEVFNYDDMNVVKNLMPYFFKSLPLPK